MAVVEASGKGGVSKQEMIAARGRIIRDVRRKHGNGLYSGCSGFDQTALIKAFRARLTDNTNPLDPAVRLCGYVLVLTLHVMLQVCADNENPIMGLEIQMALRSLC